MERVGADETTQAGSLMKIAIETNDPSAAPPSDQIFSLLQRDFTHEVVSDVVTDILSTSRATDSSKHETVLRLSTNVNGQPFVVTTNFDGNYPPLRQAAF
jgi:hypothetical protein